MEQENEKLIGLSEGKSFGLQLMRRMKQYVDENVTDVEDLTLATNAQIRAIIEGNYQYDFDEKKTDDPTYEVEEATDDDIEAILHQYYGN